jgi:hypothetical protein
MEHKDVLPLAKLDADLSVRSVDRKLTELTVQRQEVLAPEESL